MGTANPAPIGKARHSVLLTFTGFHDPYAAATVAGNEQEGPVLSLIHLHPFDQVVLFSTPNTIKNTDETARAIQERHPRVTVEIKHFALGDPTDYFEILAALRNAFVEISHEMKNAAYFIGTASGTPQMHACWVLLAASGEIPARLLHTRNVKFVTAEKPFITEIDTSRSEFPTIRSNAWAKVQSEDAEQLDPSAVIRKLGIIGDHETITNTLQRAANVAQYDVPVLILGESGTGKEKVAQLIHNLSDRNTGPFIAMNCAAIPTQLAESLLFGHVKGAFTGALASQTGTFEQADGGTLFLDEVAELSPEIQAKLLRAVQEKLIDPIGAGKSRKVNCRVVAATNSNLEEAIKLGKFRADLYHRLAVTTIDLPPLRQRRTDISKLAQYFLDELNSQYKKPRRFSPESLAALQVYEWPGNIRELCNVVQEAAIHATAGLIELKHLRLQAPSPQQALDYLPEPHQGFSLDAFLSQIRERLYSRALELADGNASKAARLLSLTPQAVLKSQKRR